MRALIADDEPHLAADLARRLRLLWPELEIVAQVCDGPAAKSALTELIPEIAFLDIRMPGCTGLEVAAAAPAGCRIVFVTAFEEHAVAAFEQAAADYLLKPLSDERLARCVQRLKQSAAPADLLAQLQRLLPAEKPPYLRWLRVARGERTILLPVDAVCCFQSADKYTLARCKDGEHLLRSSLRELAAQLDPELFWQVHRGTLVNVHQIVAAERDLFGRLQLTLRDWPEKVAVSRACAHLFRGM